MNLNKLTKAELIQLLKQRNTEVEDLRTQLSVAKHEASANKEMRVISAQTLKQMAQTLGTTVRVFEGQVQAYNKAHQEWKNLGAKQ